MPAPFDLAAPKNSTLLRYASLQKILTESNLCESVGPEILLTCI